MKLKYLGVPFIVSSLDGNNGLYTIAFSIVESEQKRTWEWFLENLLEAFGCEISLLAFIQIWRRG